MQPTSSRFVLALATLSGVCLLPGCGMDPPPAADSAPVSQTASANVPAGTLPTARTDLEVAESNGASARCNIETLAGQSLEGVYPKIEAGRSVPVLGWYAPTKVDPAVNTDTAETEGSDTTVVDTQATPASSGGPMLVIVSENGIKQWTVPLPALSERADVAKALNDPGLSLSGFNFSLDLSNLNAGYYRLHLSDSMQSAESVCGLGRGFVVQ